MGSVRIFSHPPIDSDLYSLCISISEFAERDLSNELRRIPVAAQIKSVVFGLDEKAINDPDYTELVKQIIDRLGDRGKNLELISVGKTGDTYASDDMIFHYNNNFKQIAESLAASYPATKIALLDLTGNRHQMDYATSMEKIKENHLAIDNNKIEAARKKVGDIAALIKSKTESPYEQHLLALHYIQQYVYNLDNSQPDVASRSLAEIVANNAQYICCVGYARYYTEVMRSLGFETKTQDARQHLMAKVVLRDKKYGINGVYVVDPTNLGRKADEPNPVFNNNKYSNMSMKTIQEAYSDDFCEVAALRNLQAFKALSEELYGRTFSSLRELDFFLAAEALEKNVSYTKAVDYLLKKHKGSLSSPIHGADIIEDCLSALAKDVASVPFSTRLLEEPRFAQKYCVLHAKKVVRDAKKLFAEKPLSTPVDITDFLLDHIEDKIPEPGLGFAGTITFYEKIIKERKENAGKVNHEKLFEEIEAYIIDRQIGNYLLHPEKASLYAIQHLQPRHKDNGTIKQTTGYAQEYISSLSAEEIKYRQEKLFLPAHHEISGSYDLDASAMFKNFTSLPDEEFDEIFLNTKEIYDSTQQKGMTAIKKLVRPTDYKLFKQNPTGTGEHGELSQACRT